MYAVWLWGILRIARMTNNANLSELNSMRVTEATENFVLTAGKDLKGLQLLKNVLKLCNSAIL